MNEQVRAGALRNFVTLVNQLGGDADTLLNTVGLNQQQLADPDHYIDFRAMLALLEHTATTLSCANFGLRLAIQQDFDIFGPLALAAQNCETLGDAIRCTSRFFHTHNPYKKVVLRQPNEQLARVEVRMALPNPPPCRQIAERNAMLAYQTLKMLSSNGYHPQRVLLPHPPLSAATNYRQWFGPARVLFEQDGVGIDFKVEDLELPLLGHNDQLRRIATAYLENQWQQMAQPPSLEERVRETIKTLLPSGRCKQTHLAAALCLHPRTLQRRLAVENTSFEQLKDDVRRHIAQHHLQNSCLPLSQVAALLGYSEQSALTRSCHRWFKLPPRALRQQPSD